MLQCGAALGQILVQFGMADAAAQLSLEQCAQAAASSLAEPAITERVYL